MSQRVTPFVYLNGTAIVIEKIETVGLERANIADHWVVVVETSSGEVRSRPLRGGDVVATERDNIERAIEAWYLRHEMVEVPMVLGPDGVWVEVGGR